MMNSLKIFHTFLKLFFIFALFRICGCSWLISNAALNFTDQLSQAILNNNDLQTVEDGAPAYLIMIDGMIQSDPGNKALLLSGASLYSAYSGVFVTDKERSRKLSEKSLSYALQAMCLFRPDACVLRELPFEDFSKKIHAANLSDIRPLYTLGTCWSGWIAAHRDDWNAVADISKVEAIMNQVVRLDANWDNGAAYMYLGVLSTLVPPALGGKPEVGKAYFEKAIEISGGKNLMIKVQYARQYARLVFDRELHDRLLKEVSEASADIPGYTLMNTLAKKQAKELADCADDFF